MIRAILDKGNIDQKTLANKLRVAPAQITRWLTSDAQPRLENYQKIEEIYEKLA